MQDQESKKKVLQEIMDMMDEKDGEHLKNHPKFAAKAVEIEKPEIEAEEPAVEIEGVESEDDMSPEMIQKLLEMYENMK